MTKEDTIVTHYDKKNEMLMLNTSVMHSKYCVRCYPDKKVPAVFNYGGHSLCEKDFRWFLVNNIRPQTWSNDGKIKELTDD